MPTPDPLALFGHSAHTTETTIFSRTQVTIACDMCDLTGSITSTNVDIARGVANAIVGEHMRQTEADR